MPSSPWQHQEKPKTGLLHSVGRLWDRCFTEANRNHHFAYWANMSSGEHPGSKSLEGGQWWEAAVKCLSKPLAHSYTKVAVVNYCCGSEFHWDQIILQHAEAYLATCTDWHHCSERPRFLSGIHLADVLPLLFGELWWVRAQPLRPAVEA